MLNPIRLLAKCHYRKHFAFLLYRKVRLWLLSKRKIAHIKAVSYTHLLILDEPTAGLDPGERIRFRNIISNIAKNRMVLISTHIVSDIEYIANQVVILQEGKLNRMGTVEGLCNDIQGSVWKVNVDEMTAEELMKNYLTSNIKRVDENVLMRIISKNKPIKNARMSEPQLEDVFLTVFCEQAGI